MNNFINFVRELNLTKMVISLVISGALAELVKVLIEEIVKPFTDQIVVLHGKTGLIFGSEIDYSKIVTRVVGVIASLLFAFVIFKVFKPT